MKVMTIYCKDEPYCERQTFKLNIDNKNYLYIGTPEPEDAVLFRDLDFVFSITDLMKIAWEAGKNGEVFEVENIVIKNNKEDE